MNTVSIILPTYNRARFLPQAIESIRAQQFTDWELIVVDDGSTDASPELIKQLTGDIKQPVQIIRQKNQGAYAARNTGLDHATGWHIAFFDSDDIWLPHHLQDCVEALDANPEVDWVFGPCRIVNAVTSVVISENTFEENRQPRPFMRLKHRRSGALSIIDDPRAAECILRSGLCAGLQNSVIRATTFSNRRFSTAHGSEAEDAIFVAKLVISEVQFGYLRRPHVIYNIHTGNSSVAGRTDAAAMERVLLPILRGHESFLETLSEEPTLRRAFCSGLGGIYFWRLGYSTYWLNGESQKALTAFRRGLQLRPYSIWMWKTYLLSLVRTYATTFETVLKRGFQ